MFFCSVLFREAVYYPFLQRTHNAQAFVFPMKMACKGVGIKGCKYYGFSQTKSICFYYKHPFKSGLAGK
ncbi:hypothetical protein HMPREF0971_02946 [Segatella oris F0302]|uniref:Uncharacterized protein n=1 Tax=Segatella oris F0302 TaxID=649760 RepID=D1QVG8_9BACT|nr:hypothetical protein HMPREF0971_02946 [Segatella oris F0302]